MDAKKMKKIKEEKTDVMDRISDLPTFLIHQIMSYLSTQEVAQTRLLSKRWNRFQASFPIFDFNLSPYELLENFTNFVDVSINRFCQFNLCMHTFRLSISLLNYGDVRVSSFVDRWIRLAVENDVKELDIEVRRYNKRLYSLPRAIFSSKSLTTLKLHKIAIYEQTVQKLVSGCPLLEDLFINCCIGTKISCVCKLSKLKIMKIKSYELQSVKIVVPSLQQLAFSLSSDPCVVDIAECSHLRDLTLSSVKLTEQEFHYLISKFLLLENLYVEDCQLLERINISSTQLKKLVVEDCELLKSINISSTQLKNLVVEDCESLERINISSTQLKKLRLYLLKKLKAIDVDTPNLQCFDYWGNMVSLFSINAPCSWNIVSLKDKIKVLDTRWFLRVKEFLGASNQIVYLRIKITQDKVSFNFDEFRKCSRSSMCKVQNLLLITDTPASNYEALLDGLLAIGYHKNLLLKTWDLHTGDLDEFTKWIYEKKMLNRDADCCKSCDIKCWRHYLKDVKIESCLTSKEEYDAEKVMEMWPSIPDGMLKFRLDWRFPALVGELINRN